MDAARAATQNACPTKSAVTAKLIALYSPALKNKGMSDAAAAAADSAVQTYKSHFLSDSAYMPAKISVRVVSSPATVSYTHLTLPTKLEV